MTAQLTRRGRGEIGVEGGGGWLNYSTSYIQDAPFPLLSFQTDGIILLFASDTLMEIQHENSHGGAFSVKLLFGNKQYGNLYIAA